MAAARRSSSLTAFSSSIPMSGATPGSSVAVPQAIFQSGTMSRHSRVAEGASGAGRFNAERRSAPALIETLSAQRHRQSSRQPSERFRRRRCFHEHRFQRCAAIRYLKKEGTASRSLNTALQMQPVQSICPDRAFDMCSSAESDVPPRFAVCLVTAHRGEGYGGCALRIRVLSSLVRSGHAESELADLAAKSEVGSITLTSKSARSGGGQPSRSRTTPRREAPSLRSDRSGRPRAIRSRYVGCRRIFNTAADRVKS